MMSSGISSPTLVFALVLTLLALGPIIPTNSMECYVCKNQEGNIEKCLSTVKTCDADQDTCQTELRWGSTPYWNQVADKQYYVTKKCARRQDCEDKRHAFINHCHRIWYEDWKCAECCQGDRCNYFIMMGAGNLKVNCWLMCAFTTVTLVATLNRMLA